VTLLRRAPREVYRVYDEEEFFACPVDPFADTERLVHTSLPRVVSRGLTLRRLAGSTMLIAVAGVLGSLAILADRAQPPAGRSQTREIAASGSADRPRLAQPHLYRSLARLNEPAGRDSTEHRARHGELIPASTESAPGSLPIAAAPVPTPAPAPAAALVSAGAPGRAEFGFERAGRQ
jgi:hypothetical protein